MSVSNNAQRTIDGQNTLFCDSIEVNEEIILNGDNGVDGAIIKSDGVNARWALLSSLLVAGNGINITGTTISTDLENLTAGSNIAMASVDGLETTYDGSKAITIASANTEYTAGTGLQLSVGNEFSTNLSSFTVNGTAYNGTSNISITTPNTEYTAGTGLSLSVGNEFTTNNPSTTQFFPIQQTGVAGLPSGLLYFDTLFGRLEVVP
tara:strand:- start:1000 stop:1620 length:621 start_codon:yes stop_codon:yes gene_type:complete